MKSTPYLLSLPALLLFAVVVIVPLGRSCADARGARDSTTANVIRVRTT